MDARLPALLVVLLTLACIVTANQPKMTFSDCVQSALKQLSSVKDKQETCHIVKQLVQCALEDEKVAKTEDSLDHLQSLLDRLMVQTGAQHCGHMDVREMVRRPLASTSSSSDENDDDNNNDEPGEAEVSYLKTGRNVCMQAYFDAMSDTRLREKACGVADSFLKCLNIPGNEPPTEDYYQRQLDTIRRDLAKRDIYCERFPDDLSHAHDKADSAEASAGAEAVVTSKYPHLILVLLQATAAFFLMV